MNFSGQYLIKNICQYTKLEKFLSTNGVDFVSSSQWDGNVHFFKSFDDALRWLPEFENASIVHAGDFF